MTNPPSDLYEGKFSFDDWRVEVYCLMQVLLNHQYTFSYDDGSIYYKGEVWPDGYKTFRVERKHFDTQLDLHRYVFSRLKFGLPMWDVYMREAQEKAEVLKGRQEGTEP